MVNKELIIQAVNGHTNRILLFAQAALPKEQFLAFRKLVLDEMGNSGLGKDLDRILGQYPQQER